MSTSDSSSDAKKNKIINDGSSSPKHVCEQISISILQSCCFFWAFGSHIIAEEAVGPTTCMWGHSLTLDYNRPMLYPCRYLFNLHFAARIWPLAEQRHRCTLVYPECRLVASLKSWPGLSSRQSEITILKLFLRLYVQSPNMALEAFSSASDKFIGTQFPPHLYRYRERPSSPRSMLGYVILLNIHKGQASSSALRAVVL